MTRTGFAVLMLLSMTIAHAASPPPLETDRSFDLLPSGDSDAARAVALLEAGIALGGHRIKLAGVTVDRGELIQLSRTPAGEPLVRAVRERLGRPVDLGDFLLFLDDLIRTHAHDPEPQTFWVPSGRARTAGILLHPSDVFGDRPRQYGERPLMLFEPERPADLEPAADGDPLGPRWTARFRNPETEEEMLAALARKNPGDFTDRVRTLLQQLDAQGAETYVYSTVRSPERGYLIYGAFILSRAQSAEQVRARIDKLERLNREWGLNVPIRWAHPDGIEATIEAAQAMANAYDVVYATERGARHSSHYTGLAIDFAAVDLPRRITLTAPDGSASRAFDLSDAEQPRDLNLTPEMIEWVEVHFGLRKLRRDYPHWTDARP